MPDIDIFDPRAYFDLKVRDLEQEVIARQAKAAILQSNQQRLAETVAMLESLASEQVRALQVEIAQLAEARERDLRTLETLRFEIDQLQAKLTALKVARERLEAEPPPDATGRSAPATPADGDNVRPSPGEQGRTGV